jgi:protein TonB
MGAPIQVTPDNATPVQADSGDQGVANPTMKRIQRARALAAAHQLQQAATDLENVRASITDVALKNVTSLMLIGIYLEEGNYGRSLALLEEAFSARATQKDESLRTYFAMAGQTVNGIRSHLARYRSFGLNPSETDLPAEANTDLQRVRTLLERVAAQAKEISNDAGRSYDAVALQEDVVGIRLSLASSADDHDKWQTEYVAVRERLALSQSRTTSLGRSSLLDAVTAKMPNPFANTPVSQSETSGTASPEASSGSGAVTSATSSSASPSATTATTEKAGEPQLISTGSLSGRESKRVTPVYPNIARTAKVTGVVRVFAIVDENGKVWVTNSEGPSLLRKAAEEAAKNWSFPPTLVSGKPVRVAGYLDFDFKM